MIRAWIAAVAAPLAWFAQLVIGYAVVPPAHHRGREGALLALSAGALAVTIAAAIAGALLRRALPADAHHAEPMASHRLVATAALVLGGLCALLVVCTALPIVLLGSGVEP